MEHRYNATQYKEQDVRIVTDKEVFKKLLPLLEVHEDHIKNCVPLVSEAHRLSLMAKEDTPVRIIDCAITPSKTLWKGGEYKPSTGYKTLPYASQVGRLNRQFNIKHLSKADAPLLLRDDYVFEDGLPRPFPYKLATVKFKQGFTFAIVAQELLAPYLEGKAIAKSKSIEINYSPITRANLTEKFQDEDELFDEYLRLNQYFPKQVASMLQAIDNAPSFDPKALVRADRNTPIIPMEQPIPLDNKGLVYSNVPNPTIQQLMPEGSHTFIIGNIKGTEAQILIQGEEIEQERNEVIELLMECYKPTPNPEIYKIFSAIPDMFHGRFGKEYLTDEAVRLYSKEIAEAAGLTLNELKNLMPEHQFPHWSMVPRIKELEQREEVQASSANPLIQAIQHYKETGKGISYLLFREAQKKSD